MCTAAASLESKVLVAFDSAHKPRPLEVYLQNLFCAMMNVSVHYPLSSEGFQKALSSGNPQLR